MKMFKLTALVITLSSITSSAYAISATANARVVTPVTVTETTPLNFGSFAASGTAGSITQAGVVTGGVTAVAGGATRTAGVFSVSGESSASTAYTVSLPASVTLTSGANNMSAALSFAAGTASRTLTSGADTFSVNGTLSVAANQAAGVYTGTYSVTVAY